MTHIPSQPTQDNNSKTGTYFGKSGFSSTLKITDDELREKIASLLKPYILHARLPNQSGDQTVNRALDEHEFYILTGLVSQIIALITHHTQKYKHEDLTPNEMLLAQNKRLIKAGDALYERASYTGREFDGTHRLLSAAAHWLDVRGKNSGEYQKTLAQDAQLTALTKEKEDV